MTTMSETWAARWKQIRPLHYTPHNTPTFARPGIVSRGTLVAVTRGAYSDYMVQGFFVALEDFTPLDRLDAYLTAHPEQVAEYNFKDSAFLAQLVRDGLLLEVTYATLHLTDYSSWHEFDFDPREPAPAPKADQP